MKSPTSADETFVAQLTPPGKAAIASLGLYGPLAWPRLRALFHPVSGSSILPELPQPGKVWFGRLGENNQDEVVVGVKRDGPQLWIEVHCHGGIEVVRLLQSIFEAHGMRVCSWSKFQQLTTPDRQQHRAAELLPKALTSRTAGILLDQYWGALGRTLGEILDCWQRDPLEQAQHLFASLTSYVNVGRHLTTPWRVVLAGAPNVGKSSLINALAGYQRCVVAPTPGTTRDIVRTVIAIDGWPVELADTAGLRNAAVRVEEQGIALAREAMVEADLCLWVADASSDPVWPDLNKAMQIIVNKADLPPAWDLDLAPGALYVSALTGAGVEDLYHSLGRSLVPQAPPPGTGVPFTADACDIVELAWQYYRSGRLAESKRSLETLLRSLNAASGD
jgi:tRNA modification GTPase